MESKYPKAAPPTAGPRTPTTEPPAPFWRTDETAVDRLKNRLLRAELETVSGAALVVALRRAANEAAALAWLEPFPLLVLPELFSEKASRARQTIQRQEGVRSRSAKLLGVAA